MSLELPPLARSGAFFLFLSVGGTWAAFFAVAFAPFVK